MELFLNMKGITSVNDPFRALCSFCKNIQQNLGGAYVGHLKYKKSTSS